MTFEPFVPADEAAKALGINRRFLLNLARKGIAGAYPLGTGDFRKTWVFRLSELAEAIDPKANDPTYRRPPTSVQLDYADRRQSPLK